MSGLDHACMLLQCVLCSSSAIAHSSFQIICSPRLLCARLRHAATCEVQKSRETVVYVDRCKCLLPLSVNACSSSAIAHPTAQTAFSSTGEDSHSGPQGRGRSAGREGSGGRGELSPQRQSGVSGNQKKLACSQWHSYFCLLGLVLMLSLTRLALLF